MRRKRKKGAAKAAPTSITGVRGLAHNPEVLTWVRELTRKDVSSKRIVAMSAAGEHGWPVPGESLSDGSLAACRAAIYHLEMHNVRFPLAPDFRQRPKSQTGSKLRELNELRRRDDSLLLTARTDISKATQRLEMVDFLEWGLRDADPETTASIYEELTILSAWVETSLGVVAREITDLKKLELIRKLRDTTGRTPEEARAFARHADRLEREKLSIAK